jgi:glycosyltransferase involved in cell wall biosynthesis
MQKNEKIGIAITTYNSENYFQDLYKSLEGAKYDEIVVVNGGTPYENKYNCDWIQHNKHRYPSACRNDAISSLLNRNCEHIFVIEDDMIIKDISIFEKYMEASKISNLDYLCFASTSWNSGSPSQRTPQLTVNYSKEVSLSFYDNMCNEFTYHHRSCFEKIGLYDENLRDLFDIDMVYRQSKSNQKVSPFWWFADITNSDEYIINNPQAKSRLDTNGEREKHLKHHYEYFISKHGLSVQSIPKMDKNYVINFLKNLKG